MSKRDLGQEILDGIREVKAYQVGTKILRVHSLKKPAPPQDWEQGKRQPSGPAVALLRIAEQRPEVFMQLT
jgi:putative transcriptional regulator